MDLKLQGITKIVSTGSTLVVQWLGFGVFTAVTPGSILVGELRSYKLDGVAKKKKKNHQDSSLNPRELSPTHPQFLLQQNCDRAKNLHFQIPR